MMMNMKAGYLNETRPYFIELLSNFIDSSDTLKIKTSSKLTFISSKDPGKERDMHLKIQNSYFLIPNSNENKESCRL